MPKIQEKKQVRPTLVQKPPEEKKVTVTVFRVFECVMYLEDASRRLNQVGIFPGPESQAEKLQAKLKVAKQAVDDILKDYKNLWMEMQAQ